MSEKGIQILKKGRHLGNHYTGKIEFVSIVILVSKRKLVFRKLFIEPNVSWTTFIQIFGVRQKYPLKKNIIT